MGEHMLSSRFAAALVVSGAVLGLPACAGGARSGTAGEGETATLSDDQIAGVLHAVNRELMRQAMLGRQRSVSGWTRDYAEGLLETHAAAAEVLGGLLAKERFEAAPSPLADELVASLAQTWERLAEVELSSFDRAFLETEDRVHQRLLALVDDRLLPSSQRWGLTNYLRNLRVLYARQVRAARVTLYVSPLTPPQLSVPRVLDPFWP